MTMTISCPTCKSLFRLPVEFAGRQVRCQKCENPFVVPEYAPGAQETTLGVSAAPTETPPTTKPAEPELEPKPVVQASVVETVEEVVPVKAPSTTPPIEIVVVEETKPVEGGAADLAKPPTCTPAPEPRRLTGLVMFGSLMTFALFAMMVSGGWLASHLDARPTKAGSRSVSLSSRAVPIELGPDGRLNVLGQTRQPDYARDDPRWRNDGPFELYSIHLQQGKTYNLSVSGAAISPRLQVVDGRFTNADRWGLVPENRVIISYQAKRTGEHLLFITNSQRVVGDFFLSVAEQRPAESPVFDLTEQPSVVINDALGLEHATILLDNNTTGVFREYRLTLEQNRTYSITLASDDFPWKLTIYDRNNQAFEFQRPWHQINDKVHTFSHRANFTGEYRIRVIGDRFGLGAFTLRVVDTSNAPRPAQMVLAAFQDGAFADRRVLLASDPIETSKAGLGRYKEYIMALERGQKYRIEVKSDFFNPIVVVTNDRAQRVAGDTEPRNEPLIFSPAVSGQHHIRVIGENRKSRGEYQLRIEQLP